MTYEDVQPKASNERKTPTIISDPKQPTAWVEPDPKQPLTFRAVGQSEAFPLVPLYKIIHERYAVYWKTEPRRSA